MFLNETNAPLEFHDCSLIPDLNASESEMILMQKKSLKASPRIKMPIWTALVSTGPAKAHG